MPKDAEDNRTQLERFKEAAKQVETGDAEGHFDRAPQKLVGKRQVSANRVLRLAVGSKFDVYEHFCEKPS